MQRDLFKIEKHPIDITGVLPTEIPKVYYYFVCLAIISKFYFYVYFIA